MDDIIKATAIGEDERLDEVNEKITLIQKKNGLTFGTDAFLLAAFIRQMPLGSAAELGSGTGIISLLLASREKFKKITAFEIQKDFADLSQRNIRLNGLEDKIKIVCKNITQASPKDTEGEVDAVFSNPPYMKTTSGKRNDSDAKYIARHEVCGDITDFCKAASRLLKYGGKFYAVWRPDRMTDLICAMRQSGLEPKLVTFVHADSESIPSIMLVSSTKGGRSGMTVTPPLFLYDGKDRSRLGSRAEKIYDTMSFEN